MTSTGEDKASTAVLDPVVGGELLADLGFLHVPGRPLASGSAYLFVALRPKPTLRHFDPERVDYWVTLETRGVRATLDRSTPLRDESDYAWGVISVVDRKAVVNEYVSFGGTLNLRRIDDVIVAVFRSVGPIVARGGHSQGWDLGAEEMAAFVGRLRAAAGASRTLESRLTELSPLAIYAAFVADSVSRHRDLHGVMIGSERVLEMLHSEQRWLSTECAADWQAGLETSAGLA